MGAVRSGDLRNAPVTLDVGPREVVSVNGVGMPAFRVDMEFAGLHTRSWVTDTGEVVKEESPMGLMTVREDAQRAPVMSVGWSAQTDLLEASAVVPVMKQRIAEPRDVRRLRVRLDGANLAGALVDDKARRPPGRRPDCRRRHCRAARSSVAPCRAGRS